MRKELPLLKGIFLIFFTLFLTGDVFAQQAEIPFHYENYSMESGFYNGSGNVNQGFENIFIGTVTIPDIPWLRVHFSDINLGENSYLIIRSTHDGYSQKLDGLSLKQWYNYTAFFNGDELEIELYVHPLDDKVGFKVDEVTVGDWASGSLYETICGTTDDRELSNQPATGRIVSIGCTGWIIPNGTIVTAGHCLNGSGANVLEFQVPPSLPGGTIQHPPPEDQYSVDITSKEFVDGGIGNDWGVFEVFPNSVTGLMPKDAQGAFWPLVQNVDTDSIRITGYGIDDGVRNQVQQTHVGPDAGSSGTTMRYRTDTMGGNSGSPVIDEQTQTAVGVHTHGGCNSTGGNNNGTSLFNMNFWAAVEQGAGNCPVESPFNPDPANNVINVPINLQELSWSNGAGALSNELYFGTDPGSLNLVQSGSLDSSWQITGGPLEYETNYYWQVIEIGDTCETPGPTWTFRTQRDPAIVCVFFEDFEGDLSNWTINNLGGDCIWEQYFPPYPNSYQMPDPNSNGLLSADSDECGSGTTMNTEAIIGPFSASVYQTGFIQFDNDFRTIDSDDESYVEVSTDGGSTWMVVWSQIGTSLRETTEFVDISSEISMQPEFFVKFRSVQPGWDWWWTIDNVEVCLTDEIPVELTSFTASVNDGNVTLNWSTATETNNRGFYVERLDGKRKMEEEKWETAGFIEGRGTTTEPVDYIFTDESIAAGNYSYRLKQVDYNGTFEYSNSVEVVVDVPAEYSLKQNYPNPFNPVTTIDYSIPEKGNIELTVFDVLGNKVAVLVNEVKEAGNYKVHFNAGNLSSGIYFYTMKSNNFVATKKLILLK